MTEPTTNWRLRDRIRHAQLESPAAPTQIKMSKIMMDKLTIEMGMTGDINMLFGMELVVDNSVQEDEWEFV